MIERVKMAQTSILLSSLFFLSMVTLGSSFHCHSIPISGIDGPRTPLEEEFQIVMSNINRTDYFKSYMPNTKYLLTIEGGENQAPPRKFMSFFIMVSNENETLDSGSLVVIDDTLSKYSEKCENGIVETAKLPKESVSVIWNSPVEDSGCVRIRALVIETLETWYIEDDDANEKLSIRMCPNPKAEEDDQGEILEECCACDEAKYEVSFEGLWSRNTHPKDFPSKAWLARFSDVIGASHTEKYRFWNYNGNASEGLKQVAEHGSTRMLESELKSQSEHIRTIIKARGISYPNVTGKTFAVFRVDRKHHLMSLVSMIDPSPDWFVGVSGLELCLRNCSWIEHKQFNLYPYDAGTDEGITYISEDVPTIPQQLIRRITTSFPNDSGSPFYDPFNNDMKPMAKLYINRQRIYEKICDDIPENPSNSGGRNTKPKKPDKEHIPKVCRMSSWSDWGPCSVTCGQGYQLRQRSFQDDHTAKKSNKCKHFSLSGRRQCYGIIGECELSARDSAILNGKNCELEQWSSWSSCSSTCGMASKTRSRNFKHRQHSKSCRNVSKPRKLQQTKLCEFVPCKPCEGENCEEVSTVITATESDTENDSANFEDSDEGKDVGGEELEEGVLITGEWQKECPDDRFTSWSMWSPCSTSCGPGTKVRSRKFEQAWDTADDSDADYGSLEKCRVQEATCISKIEKCDLNQEDIQEICNEPEEKGNRSCNGNYIHFYYDPQLRLCKPFRFTGCDGNRNNFKIKEDCIAICSGVESTIETTPEEDFNGLQTGSQIIDSTEEYREKVDCEYTDWSKWSECMNCDGYTVSVREILTLPRNGGKPCPKKLNRKKKCRKLPVCTLRNNNNIRRRSKDWDFMSDDNSNQLESVDCEVTQWSSWSRCTATCGEAVQHRTRTFRVRPRKHGKLCPPLAEIRDCTNLPECY